MTASDLCRPPVSRRAVSWPPTACASPGAAPTNTNQRVTSGSPLLCLTLQPEPRARPGASWPICRGLIRQQELPARRQLPLRQHDSSSHPTCPRRRIRAAARSAPLDAKTTAVMALTFTGIHA